MRYASLAALAALAVVLLLVAGTYVVSTYVLKPRREQLWMKALEEAEWTDTVVTENGRSTVLVQKVARMGHRREVVDQQFVGAVLPDAQNYDEELDKLWVTAKQRAYQLNHGPLL